MGFDPWLWTPAQIDEIAAALPEGVRLVPTDNLIDAIWPDRPAPPKGRITPWPETLAGATHAEKRARLAETLREKGTRAAVITLTDSLAWLLNIRGSDIPRNPVPQGFAILQDTGHVQLFTDPAKLDPEARAHLGDAVALAPPDAFGPALDALDGPVQLDRKSVPIWVVQRLDAAGVAHRWGEDPCILPKARKTEAEIAATRAAHLRDGAAVCEFLAWFDAQPPGTLTEIDIVTKLEQCRAATGQLLDISFDTIAGSGPNGALPHYRVTEGSNRTVRDANLTVLDSGGQYLDGTTDITRTLPTGTPGEAERAAFTRVLQGMIAISRLRFPRGLAGRDLDALARYPLWLADMDYGHGTGHGVGVYACVHEGPQRLSRISEVPLEPGMILSNEPGYYREGAFGIRIENLIVVREAAPSTGGDGATHLDFETLTFAPIDRRLIVAEMLSEGERDWLDNYHAACRDKIGPLLSGRRGYGWTRRQTAVVTHSRDVVTAQDQEDRTTGRTTMSKITIRKADGTWTVRAGRGDPRREPQRAGTDRGRLSAGDLFPARGYRDGLSRRERQTSHCPFKGDAQYYSIETKSQTIENAAWSYEAPKPDAAQIAGHIAFYTTDKVAVERI